MSGKRRANPLKARDIGAFADSLQCAPLTASEIAASRRRMMAKIHATAPPATVTVRGDEVPWERESAFRECKLLLRDFERNEQTYLVRLSPGAASAPHTHDVQEIVWVIEGEVQVDGQVIRAGDLHVAAPGSRHQDFRTSTGALVLIRSHIPDDVPRPK